MTEKHFVMGHSQLTPTYGDGRPVGNEAILANGYAVHGDHVNGYSYVPIRYEDELPYTFRFALYPDGSRRLQGGYAWRRGLETGTVWKDLPCVQVGADGQEVPA